MKRASKPRQVRERSVARSRIAGSAISSALAGIFAYCALSILAGPAGLSAYEALEARKAAMEANLGELAAINERLSGELDALMSDPDRAVLEARSLGYLRKGEVELAQGLSTKASPRIEIGEVLPYTAPTALGDGPAKGIALGIAIAIFTALLAPVAGKSRNESPYRGRLVQTASLE